MKIENYFDKTTSTLTYIVWDPLTKDAVIIDPVLNYDLSSSTYDLSTLEDVIGFIKANELRVHYVMETHAHADHLTGAQELKKQIPSIRIVIGEKIAEVQKVFKDIFNFGDDFKTDGSQFDVLATEAEEIVAGTLRFKVIQTPGHTSACSSYQIEDVVFTGDVLFMPDSGVARCDFPGGDAAELFRSVKNKLYALADSTRVFTAHDYQPGGRELQFESTIGESKKSNIHLNDRTTEEEFTKFRKERDETLAAPRLLFPSIEVNIAGGVLPKPESNGVSYLKTPIRERV